MMVFIAWMLYTEIIIFLSKSKNRWCFQKNRKTL